MATGWIRARAPATIANLGPGFDVFALAVRGPADEVAIRPAKRDSLQAHGVGAAGIPSTFSGNTAGDPLPEARNGARNSPPLPRHVPEGRAPGPGPGRSAGSRPAAGRG